MSLHGITASFVLETGAASLLSDEVPNAEQAWMKSEFISIDLSSGQNSGLATSLNLLTSGYVRLDIATHTVVTGSALNYVQVYFILCVCELAIDFRSRWCVCSPIWFNQVSNSLGPRSMPKRYLAQRGGL